MTDQSASEGHSVTNSLHHGLISSRADPPEPELVDGRNALIVPPKDVMALARAMRDLVERPGLRASLRAGVLEVGARHSRDVIGRQHVEAYDEELSRRRAGAREPASSRSARRA